MRQERTNASTGNGINSREGWDSGLDEKIKNGTLITLITVELMKLKKS